MPLTDIATVTVDASWSTNPDAAPTWVNIPPVEDVSLGAIGRTYELDSVNPARNTIRVDNTDGSYSAGAPISGGQVTTDKRMRVRAALVGGSTYTLADHIIESCPTTLDSGGFDYASSSFTTVDYMDALSASDLNSPYVEQVLSEKPYAYFTLGDTAGSTTVGDLISGAVAPFGNRKMIDSAAPVTGLGAGALGGGALYPVADSTTCVSLSPHLDGSSLPDSGWVIDPTGVVASLVDGGSPTAWGVRVTFQTITSGTSYVPTIFGQGSATNSGVQIGVDASGHIVVNYAAQNFTSSGTYNSGATHEVLLYSTGGGSLFVYIDGVLAATLTWAGVLTAADRICIGAFPISSNAAQHPINGLIGHVALYGASHAITSGSAAWNAGLGFAGETAGTRIARTLGWVGYTGTTAIDAGTTALGPQLCDGKSAMQDILDTAAVEDGIFYIAGTGFPTFRARSVRYASTSVVTLNTTALPVETANLSFEFDRQHMVNDITVTRPNGPTVRATDPVSIAQHRTRNALNGTVTLNVNSDADLLARAQWLLFRYSQPRRRVGTIRLRPFTTPALAVYACTLQPFDRITLTNLPANAPASTMDFLIESVSHPQISNDEWICELSLSPWMPMLLLEDVTYGRLVETAGSMTLNGTITSSATSISVATSGGNPTFSTTSGDYSPNPLLIQIDQEVLAITAAPGSSSTPQTLTVTRAQAGTFAAAHTTGAAVSVYTGSLVL